MAEATEREVLARAKAIFDRTREPDRVWDPNGERAGADAPLPLTEDEKTPYIEQARRELRAEQTD